jgi:hypothetical protein
LRNYIINKARNSRGVVRGLRACVVWVHCAWCCVGVLCGV